MAASEGKLSRIHELLADNMIDLLSKSEGPISASSMQAISKFLKDNLITKTPDADGKLARIDALLAERQANRRARALTESEIDAAIARDEPHEVH